MKRLADAEPTSEPGPSEVQSSETGSRVPRAGGARLRQAAPTPAGWATRALRGAGRRIGAPPLYACAVLGLIACEEPTAEAPVCGAAYGSLGYRDGEAGLPMRDGAAAARACAAAGLPAPDIAHYETRYRAGAYVARANRGFSAKPYVAAAPTPAAPTAAAPAASPVAAPAAAPLAPPAPAEQQTAAAPVTAPEPAPQVAPQAAPQQGDLAARLQQLLDARAEQEAAAAPAAPAAAAEPAAPVAAPARTPTAALSAPAPAAPAPRLAAPVAQPPAPPSAPIAALPAPAAPVDRTLASEPPRDPSGGESALIRASKSGEPALSASRAAPAAQGPCGASPCPSVAETAPTQASGAAVQGTATKRLFQQDNDLSRVPDSVLKPTLSPMERRMLGLP